jgi:hypothetical protein
MADVLTLKILSECIEISSKLDTFALKIVV